MHCASKCAKGIAMLTSTPSRRAFLKGAVVAGAALAVPSSLSAPIFAAPSALPPRDRRLFAIAQAELDRLGGRITHHDLVAIADFGHHSAKPRFHFLSFKLNKVRSFLVTHGQGSDADHNGWLSAYSNRDGSLATSRGAYVTGEVYEGKYGTSYRLDGLEPTNSNARPRAIVGHAADYARASHVAQHGKLGRSFGCFAMDPADFGHAINLLPGGRLLLADSYGIDAQGKLAANLPGGLRALTPEKAYGRARLLPGVY
jgi:hypothetical protein